MPAIVLSVLIAVPLGRLAYRHPRVGGALLSAATLLYAIPALPLLIIISTLRVLIAVPGDDYRGVDAVRHRIDGAYRR
ncbi:hypothetical protein [Arthrobacter sp. JCM 19049]|uniref:hypothetical protein n=1 Tax=Arthrobacter sp. JCM 19049 TaxID=1460643 RepID=UPI002436357E|nr:hypothetical protein [Arthrobacter sp. JCM 19049]